MSSCSRNKNKYIIRYKCSKKCCKKCSQNPTTGSSDRVCEYSSKDVICGNRTVYFRQFAPNDTVTPSDGDIWLQCSQTPGQNMTQYIYRDSRLIASDVSGNLYLVNDNDGSGTHISSYISPYDNASPNPYYPPYANCDVVIDPISNKGYVFGLLNTSMPQTSIITEFNASTYTLTGRTVSIPYPAGITDIYFIYISAAMYYPGSPGSIFINVFVNQKDSNDGSEIFWNYIYTLNPTDLSITCLGFITAGFTKMESELISGITYDEKTNTIYAVTNFNDVNFNDLPSYNYSSGNLYTIDLTTFEATLVSQLSFPAAFSGSYPVAQSLNLFENTFYVGMCYKSYGLNNLPVPNNLPYLLSLDVTNGVLTLVDPTLTNIVMPITSNGGVVGLTSIGGWYKVYI